MKFAPAKYPKRVRCSVMSIEKSVEKSIKNLLSDGIKATPPSFVRGILRAASDPGVISFAGGLPNPVSFPQEELLVSMERVVKTTGSAVRCRPNI